MNKVWNVSGKLGFGTVILRVFDNQKAAHKFALAVEKTLDYTYDNIKYSSVIVREYGVETNVWNHH